jgi:pectate lyase
MKRRTRHVATAVAATLVGLGCGSSGSEAVSTAAAGAAGAGAESGSCPPGQLLCAAECVDPATDASNCGNCGNRCPAGEICVDRVCSDPGAASAGGSGGNPGGGTSGGSGAEPSGGTSGEATGGMAGQPDCPMQLEGWATVSGDGVSSTTGGGSVTPVRPTSSQELMDYASDDTARVIEIVGTFDVPRLQVASSKTLLGVGTNATINGGIRIRGYADDNVSNVIVRNLRVNGATTDVDGDAMQVYFAHHVWIDHCEIWDGPDANLDAVHASNWVTISWTKFRYTSAAPDPSHKFSNLIGHSDNNASEDRHRLKVTLHHNWWADGVTERMPRVRFGEVHVFNNYYSSAGNNYCIRAGIEAHILSESNYFYRVSNPHEYNNSDDEATAHITQRNNVFDGTSGDNVSGGGGTAFTSPPYAASIDDASAVPALVQACAGPQ